MVEEDPESRTNGMGTEAPVPAQALDGIQPTDVPGDVSQDGVDGDDELDEDDAADDDDDDEQALSDEDEPRLKYQRLGGSVPGIVGASGASCLTVADRIIALGTTAGTVHLLDYQGNQVKEFSVHTEPVNELSFDVDGEYIGSCSDDGTVVVSSLYSDERERHDYHRPVKAVALDPEYGRKSSKQFAAGGLAGQLILNSKGWLGARDVVLHAGEGAIHAIKWRTSLIAWANNFGVKIYDTATQQRLSFIERPPESPRPELLRPQIVWQDDAVFVIGWADSVKVAAVRTRSFENRGVLGSSPANALGGDLLGRAARTSISTKYVEIVASFRTDYYISGVAPYGDSIVVLAYIPHADTTGNEPSNGTFQNQGISNRPEMHIVTRKNEELASSDALSVLGYEHYEAKDYLLAHAPFLGSSSGGGQWAEGYEPLYYIVSPRDVVVARPRDAEDHVAWLLQHGWHEKALAAVEAGNTRTELLDEVGSRYLDHLVLERQYAQAAALCPKLLRGSSSAWERWIMNFAQLRQLPKLAPYVPTSNPQLRDTVYEIVLNSLLINPAYHEQLLSTIKTWPSNIYSVPTIINAAELQLNTSLRSQTLQEALATLYLMVEQYDKTLAIYLELQKPNVLEFIEQHNLYGAVRDKVIPLMTLDGKRAVSLYVQQSNMIPASEVVPQLLREGNDTQYKALLHSYLHALFEKDPNAGKDFHYLQVELYAEYEPRLLLPFLRSSQHYTLDKAYEICKRRALTKEMVFILGRMGNTREALALIINQLRDMQQAIDFVTAQHDDELWDELINQCLNKPEMVGALLEHTVGNIDPLHLVNKIPLGMAIPRLRDRLVKIITDYRTETSLRHGCNDILKADCVDLLVRYYHEARHAIRVGGPEGGVNVGATSTPGTRQGSKQGAAAPSRTLSMKTGSTGRRSNVGGSGRCCICLDPVGLQNVAVVAFFCTHAYHVTCLQDPASISNAGRGTLEKGQSGTISTTDLRRDGKSASQNGDASSSNSSKGPEMRCILCTTAASASKKRGDDGPPVGRASNGWGA